jgi:hypothetical protein
MSDKQQFIFSDLALARRLERAEAQGNLEFVEARARLFPDSGAQWVEVAGTYAMYDGVESPVTQTFGLGMFQAVPESELEQIELFFQERGAPVFHEVSPLADSSAMTLLNKRGYQPLEFTSVMFRPISRGASFTAARNQAIKVRQVGSDEHDLWAQTAFEGWSEFPELAGVMLEFCRINANKPGGLSFLAELDGQAIATGALTICGGVALMAGASTIPAARKQGAQLAILDHRLSFASEQGCDIAMMGALPGSASQRNAERQGFRIAYTRIKWHLPQSARR